MPQSFYGLATSEAQKRLVKYGPNKINDAGHLTALKILLRQIKGNFIVYLLAFSAAISFAIGKVETTYTLFAVVFVVIFFGFIQEYKAERAVSALKNMLTAVTLVVRDGKEQQLQSADLVPGDIVILRNGERVPADAAVLEQKSLLVNEAVLTGESKEIAKNVCENAEKCDESNTVYMGTFIVGGHCVAQVLHTGMNSRFGKIALLISTAEKELTLQKKVNAIGKYMVIAGILVSIATGGLMFARNPVLDWANLTEIIILVVALSVSSFPEGLPVVLTTTLALGASKMARNNAIVNRMSVIETLGETTVICSDKTGTLTTGHMTVKRIFCGEDMYEVTGAGLELAGSILLLPPQAGKPNEIKPNNLTPEMQRLIKCCVVCNDAIISNRKNGKDLEILGSPTEAALLVLGAKTGLYKEDLELNRLEELPFSSERKAMSVLVEEGVERVIYAKGAPEMILNKCTLVARRGMENSLTESDRNTIKTLVDELAKASYRTLALAYKRVEEFSITKYDYKEEDLVLLGLLALEDPPREGVTESIAVAAKAGIETKIVTGDNIGTAISIGRQIGLEGKSMEGVELDDLSDEELAKIVESIRIFARVRPEHKIRIVRALKQNGHIVAMTGDGVNDAPALKEAHVGIAMGRNGTDVSRAAADITLKDDNYSTIVAAIKEGRAVFNNIQKFVTYQLGCNFAELAILFIGTLAAPFLGWHIPLITAIQILFMNLVTDSIPAITLGFNPTSPDIMLGKSINSKRIINRFTLGTLVLSGTVMAVFTLAASYFSFNVWNQNNTLAATTTLATLICVEVITAFTFRSFRKPVLSRSPFVNMPLVWAALGSLTATIAIIYTPLNVFFETTPIGVKNWALVAGLCLGISLVFDLIKLVKPQTQHA